LVRRRDLLCYGIRSCNAVIDVGALEILLWQAAQAVRIRKRRLAKIRTISATKHAGQIHFYRKSYDFPLNHDNISRIT
jgi:hypothetical protein